MEASVKQSAVLAIRERYATAFWSRVDQDGPTPEHRPDLGPCWIWTAGGTGNGYGIASIGRKQQELAHRVAYILSRGAIPDGTVTDHLCRVPRCVNPDHLEAVPQRVNTLRGLRSALRNPTHCSNGHPISHTRTAPSGRRVCRDCERERKRRWKTRSAA